MKKGIPHDHGMIKADTGGRTDVVNIDVPQNAFVVPADIVSALGEGNSESGRAKLEGIYGSSGKSGAGKVPIVAAGGEFVISPDALAKVHGDLGHGLQVWDKLVPHIRKETIKTLKALKKPRK